MGMAVEYKIILLALCIAQYFYFKRRDETMAKKRKRREGRNAKTDSMFKHAKLRAFQHYGVVLTNAKLDEIVRQIKNRESEFVFRQSVSRRWHWVTLDDVRMLCIYDPTRGGLHTFMIKEDIAPMLEAARIEKEVGEYVDQSDRQ